MSLILNRYIPTTQDSLDLVSDNANDRLYILRKAPAPSVSESVIRAIKSGLSIDTTIDTVGYPYLIGGGIGNLVQDSAGNLYYLVKQNPGNNLYIRKVTTSGFAYTSTALVASGSIGFVFSSGNSLFLAEPYLYLIHSLSNNTAINIIKINLATLAVINTLTVATGVVAIHSAAAHDVANGIIYVGGYINTATPGVYQTKVYKVGLADFNNISNIDLPQFAFGQSGGVSNLQVDTLGGKLICVSTEQAASGTGTTPHIRNISLATFSVLSNTAISESALLSQTAIDSINNKLFTVERDLLGIYHICARPIDTLALETKLDCPQGSVPNTIVVDNINGLVYTISVNTLSEFSYDNVPIAPGGEEGLGGALVLTCDESSGVIHISWITSQSAGDGFAIERATSPAGPYTEIGRVNSPISEFTDNAAAEGVLYYYRVRSFAGSVYSQYTQPATINCEWHPHIPCRPSSLHRTLLSPSTVAMSWNYSTTGDCGTEVNRIDGFKIQRKRDDEAAFTLIGTVGASQRAYNDATILPGYVYSYIIYAYNAQRNGYLSEELVVDTSDLLLHYDDAGSDESRISIDGGSASVTEAAEMEANYDSVFCMFIDGGTSQL
jgi:hypothetical protein